ncbi:MAG: FRG domain-containing protein [Novosphingobium sp.]|uniref:FRG domain-containing protein n=1 Tax=Novosphingobium sp. TaxID=1874826 RepID=UPI0022BBCD1A|nr:FRG domain-containing protein [Novosphingobium sp.]MCZ8036493.1 FRG domain-containing protein [Novosphingobium sp.]
MVENFNYISFGDPSWLAGDAPQLEMGRGRMFEHTPTDVEPRLVALDAPALAFLEKLPAFLCSEIDSEAELPTMLVKFGRIQNTHVEKKVVRTQFVTEVDFGEVAFSSVEAAKNVFGLANLQVYRTHWAVRPGDYRAILAKLTALTEQGRADVQRILHGPPEAAPEPPVRRKNVIGLAGSVEDFLKILFAIKKAPGTESFYRGHHDATFELTPSLLRRWTDGSWKHLPDEDRLCKEVLIAHHDEFQGDHYCFDRLVRMQHYGLPTRLLDISGNPLVALFFACHCDPKLMGTDGEVIIFRIDRDRVKYFDSDTVSCLANLSNLSHAQKNQIDLSLDLEAFNRQEVARRLLHHIRSEKSYFEACMKPDDLGSVLCVKAKRTNSRIKSQSGAFLLFGHEALLPEWGNEGIEVSRVKITDKAKIMTQLDAININATTVYPSIEQTTVHLRDRHLSPQPR